jgi:large repetitive protein
MITAPYSRFAHLLVLLFLLAGPLSSTAQKAMKPGWYTLGFNGGMAYQQSDVRARLNGFGLGLTLAKNLYAPANRGLEFDLRGRYLYTRSFGLSHIRRYDPPNYYLLGNPNAYSYAEYPANLNVSRGFVFQNHRTDIHALGLEGVFTLAGLRKKHGVVLSLYGGAELVMQTARTDQQRDGLPYFESYAGIDTTLSGRAIRRTLRNDVLDGNYESSWQPAFPNYKDAFHFMPYLGIELGYDISPYWGIGLGHKMTFSGIDNLDGYAVANSGNDRYHYTYAQVYFRFYGEEKEVPLPEIIFIRPNVNPESTQDEYYDLLAEVRHVKKQSQVQLFLNDRKLPFDFSKNQLSATLLLQEGVNTVRIHAENKAGKAVAETQIILLAPEGLSPVSIRFINPETERITVNEPSFRAIAEVLNITNRRNLSVSLNGRPLNRFGFNEQSGILDIPLSLAEGVNTVMVQGSNRISKASATVYIDYRKPVFPPVITLKQPPGSPWTTQASTANLDAHISNIETSRQIRLVVNGNDISGNGFQFNAQNGQFQSGIPLLTGQNFVRISAENSAGSDSKDLIIIREAPLPTPPVVKITTFASVDPIPGSNTCRYQLSGTTLHLHQKGQIALVLNDRMVLPFLFNPANGLIEASFEAPEGPVDVVLSGTNEFGTASDRRGAMCQIQRLPRPEITLLQPTNGAVLRQNNAVVSARIMHITTKGQVRFQVNGQMATDFTFDPQTGAFSAGVTLREGTNTLSWRATNATGSADASLALNYTPPAPPIIQWVNPAGDPFITESDFITLEAEVKNIAKGGDIRLFLNGRRQLPLSFDLKTRRMTRNTRLSPGENRIRIEARNEDGVAEASRLIVYQPKKNLPAVTIISASLPTTSPMNPDVGRSTIIARVQHITSRTDIRFTFNGQIIEDFEYNESIGEIKKLVNLTRGKNTVHIEVKNAEGTATDTMDIEF